MPGARFILTVGGVLAGIFVLSHLFFAQRSFALDNDAGQFHAIAQSLAGGRGFVDPSSPRTSDREPVYPLFLAAVYRLAGSRPWVAIFFQAVVGFLAFLAMAGVMAPLLGRFWAGSLAILSALMPGVAVMAVGSLLTETIAAALLIAAYLVLFRMPCAYWRYGLGGFLLGLAALTRFSFLFFPFVLVGALLLFRRRWDLAEPVRTVGLLLAGFALPVLLWTARNYRTLGVLSPTGSKGGNEFLVRARKAEFSGEDLRAYLFGALSGDYLARRLYPRYAAVIEPHVDGVPTRTEYNRLSILAERPEEVSRWAIREGVGLAGAHPLRYLLGSVAEFFKLNSPMLWHNAADIRHLFVGTHPELPSWFKAGFVVLYRLLFFAGVGLAFYALFGSGFQSSVLLFPALLILYTNTFYLFFDSYPRYAVPLYPFYVLLGIWWLRSFLLGRLAESRGNPVSSA